jgi:hypothetical protein
MQVLSWPGRATRVVSAAFLATLLLATGFVAPGTASASMPTTTNVRCGTGIRLVGSGASCVVEVSSSGIGATAPTGTVKFSAEGGPITPTSCTLLKAVGPLSFCGATYAPKKGGVQTITASYQGDPTHLGSIGATSVSVSDSTTTVTCDPDNFSVLEGTTCTAAVHNAGAASDELSGTLSFELPHGGRIEPSSCNVAESSVCTLKFSAEIADFNLINATYSGDATHPGSNGQALVFGREASASAVDCGPAVRFPGAKVECRVRTQGFHSVPNHGDTIVPFTAEGRQVGSCLMAVENETEGTCAVSFTVTEPGLQTVSADYPGDLFHFPSSGRTTIAVSATTTRLQCQPESLAVGEATACTAEVRNTGGASDDLSGTMSFKSSQSGRFEPSSCNVSQSHVCTVNFLPEIGGKHTVTATYEGDATHPASHWDASLAVRGTSVKLSCPDRLEAVQAGSCLVRVVNEGLGSKDLTGTVNFSASGEGSFSSGQCTLAPFANGEGGFCSTSYTPSAAGAQVVHAVYSGDATHPPANDGFAEISVLPHPTTTTLSCAKTPAPGETTSCLVHVVDNSTNFPSRPTGEVHLSTDGGGSSTRCTEFKAVTSVESTCTVFYTANEGAHRLIAEYRGDKIHGKSEGSVTLVHAIAFEIDCGSRSTLGGLNKCIATVRDSDGAAAPTGVIQFVSSALGEFNRPDCTLQPTAFDTSTCAVAFTPLAETTYTITGAYAGDPAHDGGVATTTLAVGPG